MLTDQQLDDFHGKGYVRLDGALTADEAASMRERMLSRLRRNGVDLDDPATWPDYPSDLQSIRKGDPAPEDSALVAGAFDSVFAGRAWNPPGHWGQALVTFPKADEWTVPHRIWHLDHPYSQPPGYPSGVNVFLYADDVEPGQGGTVAIEGSPRLIARFAEAVDVRGRKMKQLRQQFHATHPWLRDLARPTDEDRIGRFMTETDIDGLPARVVELTGRAGDVVVCHPWLVHSGAPNAGTKPRLMRACRAYDRRYKLRLSGVDPDSIGDDGVATG